MPGSAREVDRQRLFDGSRTARLMRTGTGEPGIALRADVPEPGGSDVVEVRAGYDEGGLSTASYRCPAIRVGEGRVVRECDPTSIS